MLEEVRIDKLVHGGQGMGTLPNGKKVFAWNTLPGETVRVRLLKGKKRFAEAIAEEIITPSGERIDPVDEAYLSTSPWQVMTFESENRYKQEIIIESMQREKVIYEAPFMFQPSPEEWHYRNKMEYSFWGDDDGLHLALFKRGSHGKQIITGSSIARTEIDEIANKICSALNNSNIRASQLKTVVIRCDRQGNTVAALFVKDETFPQITQFSTIGKGIEVNFSTPKSPASVCTRNLYSFGDTTLTDTILGCNISYDVNSFFQVNIPVFELAAQKISEHSQGAAPVVDFYSGVGTIGIPVGATVLVESDAHNVQMARMNTHGKKVEIVHAAAETAIEHIPNSGVLIVDPPRAGLHPNMTKKILENLPEKVLYLSCNPSTHARDLALLQGSYRIDEIAGYNFFPRTPHIESFAVLTRR